MAPTSNTYTVLGERAAEVDDVRLEPGGEPQKLTKDQVKRLEDAGVALADGDKGHDRGETAAAKAKREKAEQDKADAEAAKGENLSTPGENGGDR